jgi:hypothetical protein
MSSAIGDRAIDDALRAGRALLKFISPNDVGLTGGHQYGFLLPNSAWDLFAPFPPEKGTNRKAAVNILWQDGRRTASVVTWYGAKTRREYRLTRFGRDFPFRVHDLVGALLVLIPTAPAEFVCYVLDTEEDIDDLQAALGVEVIGRYAVFDRATVEEPEDQCLDRYFRDFAVRFDEIPETRFISGAAREAVFACVKDIRQQSVDERLMRFRNEEFRLFKMLERRVREPEITRLFQSIDDFIDTALRILNARKSRAGRSLENHVEFLLQEAQIPFDMRADVDGRPDILIPGKREYDESIQGKYPKEKLVIVGVKTTCKDRWRQVTREAKHIEEKHIFTTQAGISPKQLDEMKETGVRLVVPKPLHDLYPAGHGDVIDLEQFITNVRAKLA